MTACGTSITSFFAPPTIRSRLLASAWRIPRAWISVAAVSRSSPVFSGCRKAWWRRTPWPTRPDPTRPDSMRGRPAAQTFTYSGNRNESRFPYSVACRHCRVFDNALCSGASPGPTHARGDEVAAARRDPRNGRHYRGNRGGKDHGRWLFDQQGGNRAAGRCGAGNAQGGQYQRRAGLPDR